MAMKESVNPEIFILFFIYCFFIAFLLIIHLINKTIKIVYLCKCRVLINDKELWQSILILYQEKLLLLSDRFYVGFKYFF